MSDTPEGPGQDESPPDYLSTSVITDLTAERQGTRSWLPWLIAVDTLVVLLVITGLYGVKAGWFSNGPESGESSGAGGPANGGPPTAEQISGGWVPSTPRALVAAVLAALPAGTLVDDFEARSKPAQGAIIATLTITGPNGHHGQLIVTARPPIGPIFVGCPQPGNLLFCRDVSLADGRTASSSAFTDNVGLDVYVGVMRRGVLLEEKVAGTTTTGELPLTLRQLARIAFDPLVRIRTSQVMVERGETLFQPGLVMPITIGKAGR